MEQVGRIVGDIDYRGKPRVQTVNEDPSETIQSDAHLTDVKNIMASFGARGHDMLDETALEFADVSEFTDLRDALDQAKNAEEQFMRLPSKVREIFGHDVAVWLDTAHDKDKRDALVAKGFLKALPVDSPGGAGAVADATGDPEGTDAEGEPTAGGTGGSKGSQGPSEVT